MTTKLEKEENISIANTSFGGADEPAAAAAAAYPMNRSNITEYATAPHRSELLEEEEQQHFAACQPKKPSGKKEEEVYKEGPCCRTDEEEESPRSPRRRPPRHTRPGAFPEGGDGVSRDDGTIVVGENTSVPPPDLLQMEPLHASVVRPRRKRPPLDHADDDRRIESNKKRITFLFVLLAALVIFAILFGLILGLSGTLSSSSDDDGGKEARDTPPPTTPPVPTEWVPVGLPEDIAGSDPWDDLGLDIALSRDGSTVASGPPYADFPYVLSVSVTENSTVPLGEDGRLDVQSPYSFFGWGVSLSHHGEIMAVGGYNVARVYKLDSSGSVWERHGQDLYSLGSIDTSLSADGSTLAVSGTFIAPNGVVQVYQYDFLNNRWREVGNRLVGGDSERFFGWSVALSADGNRLAVGIPDGDDESGSVPSIGRVRVYEFNGTDWLQMYGDLNGIGDYDAFGVSVALSDNGRCVAAGAPQNIDLDSSNVATGVVFTDSVRSGYACVYCLQDDSGWELQGRPVTGRSGDGFGVTVDLSADGRTLAVGSPRANSDVGQVDIFRFGNDPEDWIPVNRFEEKDNDVVSYSWCGAVSLSSNGDVVAFGCPYATVNGVVRAGTVRVYRAIPCSEGGLSPENPDSLPCSNMR